MSLSCALVRSAVACGVHHKMLLVYNGEWAAVALGLWSLSGVVAATDVGFCYDMSFLVKWFLVELQPVTRLLELYRLMPSQLCGQARTVDALQSYELCSSS